MAIIKAGNQEIVIRETAQVPDNFEARQSAKAHNKEGI